MNSIQQALSNINAYKLYHKDVYVPLEYVRKTNNLLCHCKGYIFSKHLKEQCNSDYKHEFEFRELNHMITNMQKYEIFEIETQFGEVTKFCIRIKYNERDFCVALMPIQDNKILVKTVWRNDKNDLHETLDKTKYEIK